VQAAQTEQRTNEDDDDKVSERELLLRCWLPPQVEARGHAGTAHAQQGCSPLA
jgi:hypothetical protein